MRDHPLSGDAGVFNLPSFVAAASETGTASSKLEDWTFDCILKAEDIKTIEIEKDFGVEFFYPSGEDAGAERINRSVTMFSQIPPPPLSPSPSLPLPLGDAGDAASASSSRSPSLPVMSPAGFSNRENEVRHALFGSPAFKRALNKKSTSRRVKLPPLRNNEDVDSNDNGVDGNNNNADGNNNDAQDICNDDDTQRFEDGDAVDTSGDDSDGPPPLERNGKQAEDDDAEEDNDKRPCPCLNSSSVDSASVDYGASPVKSDSAVSIEPICCSSCINSGGDNKNIADSNDNKDTVDDGNEDDADGKRDDADDDDEDSDDEDDDDDADGQEDNTDGKKDDDADGNHDTNADGGNTNADGGNGTGDNNASQGSQGSLEASSSQVDSSFSCPSSQVMDVDVDVEVDSSLSPSLGSSLPSSLASSTSSQPTAALLYTDAEMQEIQMVSSSLPPPSFLPLSSSLLLPDILLWCTGRWS